MEFKFDFKPVVSKREKIGKIKQEYIIEKGVSGVIHITLDASFYIVIDKINYNLTSESFNCFNKKVVFYKGLINGNIIRAIRLSKIELSDYNKFYMPFSIGSYVSGNLVRENNKILFDFKRLENYDELTRLERVNAINYFKNNYEIIKELLNV